jgi:hypothetical protein
MFCYKSAELCELLLEPWFIQYLDKHATETQKKKYAKNCCLVISPEDNNCPFILSNLTFLHFSNFVMQQKECKGKSQGKVVYLGNLSYEQCQSELKHLFCMSKYNMELDFFDHLKQFTKGIRNHVANKKELEGYANIIGKKKMGFNVYKKICELVLKEEGKEFMFACAFLCLEWNIMARSKNVVHAHILHIEWNADSLVFCFVKSKGNQTGRNSNQEWHVYANPHNPKICLILALACYIFFNPGIFLAAVDDEVVEGGGSGHSEGTPIPRRKPVQPIHGLPAPYFGKVFQRVLCVGYLAWQSGIALGKERHKQPCLQWINGLDTNGVHISPCHV